MKTLLCCLGRKAKHKIWLSQLNLWTGSRRNVVKDSPFPSPSTRSFKLYHRLVPHKRACLQVSSFELTNSISHCKIIEKLTFRRITLKGEGPYFPSVTRKSSHKTDDKPEADSAPILPTSLHQCSVYGYLKLFKATRKGKKSKQDGFSHPSIDLWTFRTESRAITDCANPFYFDSAFCCFSFHQNFSLW